MAKGDSFLFNIKNSRNYPKYLDDSVMNTYPDFDKSSFINLEIAMKRKIEEKDLTESLFAFTFVQEGTFVFYDAANIKKIMIITVKAKGETCADPDRYVQTVSGSSLAEVGISTKKDIIL